MNEQVAEHELVNSVRYVVEFPFLTYSFLLTGQQMLSTWQICVGCSVMAVTEEACV